MARKPVAFSWQILSDQVESDDANARPFFAATAEAASVHAQTVRSGRRFWWGLLGLAFVVAVVAGYRLYRTAQAGVTALESELQEAIVLDSYTTANPAVAAAQTPPALQSYDLHDGVAAVEMVVHDPARPLPYRTLRFYQETASGWQPTKADAGFWGSPQQLESRQFSFHYRRRDAAAVAAAAPALDALYAGLHQGLGRAMPDAGAKVVVEVFASYGLEERGLYAASVDPIRVPSPGLLQIPVDVSDAEALALSINVSLVYRLLPQAPADWLATGDQSPGWWWPPLTEGLRLWLLWDNDLLPTRWRRDILSWYLANSCQSCRQRSQELPAGYREFCQLLTMLGLYPPHVSISIPCAGHFSEADIDTFFLSPPSPPTHLSGLAALPAPEGSPARMEADRLRMSYGGQLVSMATLLEYVAHTYGRERIPVLLGAFGTYQRWETLVPAVFGITTAAFEAGWRAYLQEHYGTAAP